MGFHLTLVIFGMFLSNCVAGIINITGTIAPYLLSYFYDKDSSVHLSTILTTSFIAITVQVINFYIISQLSKKFPEFSLMIVGHVISTSGFFSLSFIENPYLFIFVFGCCLGFYGSFMSYPAMWIGLRKVSPEKRGIATGIGLSSFALAPFIFGYIFSCIINPNNKSPTRIITYGDEELKLFDKEVFSRLPMTIRYLSLILLIIGIFATVIMYDKSLNTTKSTYSITFKQLLKEYKSWYLLALNFLKMLFFMFIINVYKTVGLLYIEDDYLLSYIGGAGFLLAAILRIFIGRAHDRYPWHKINFITTLLELVIILFYYYTLPYWALYTISTVLLIGISGTSYLCLWILCDMLFPKDKWVFSFVSLGGVFATFIASIVFAGVLFPLIGYEFTFYVMAGLQIACLVLICNLPKVIGNFNKVGELLN